MKLRFYQTICFVVFLSFVTGSFLSTLQDKFVTKTKWMYPSSSSLSSPSSSPAGPKSFCCAENKEGNFYANISFVADLGTGNHVPGIGYMLAERMKRLLYNFGTDSRSIESSKAGFSLRECDKDQDHSTDTDCKKKAILTVWDSQQCKTLKVPKVCLHGARMCVGKSTVWPTYFSTTTIDPTLKLSSYRLSMQNESYLSSIYVNDRTCSPLHMVTAVGKKGSTVIDNILDMVRTLTRVDNLGSPTDPLNEKNSLKFRAPLSGMGKLVPTNSSTSNNRIAKPADYNWANILFHNNTAMKPPKECFVLPSWCKKED